MFEKYGSVVYVSLPKFKNGTIKRFAFVEFDNKESANKVLEVRFQLCLFNNAPTLYIMV